jgi:hypothetical protein
MPKNENMNRVYKLSKIKHRVKISTKKKTTFKLLYHPLYVDYNMIQVFIGTKLAPLTLGKIKPGR